MMYRRQLLDFVSDFLRSSENPMSGVRSKNPISRRQLVLHLQWNRPMNCCFILRPQFGQIRLLALIKVYWSLATISSADIPLASSFFNTDSASAFLDSSAAFFSAATFFASALESSFAATFKADFLLFNCSFSVLMLLDSAAISVSICSLAAIFSATIAASLWCYRHHQAHRLRGKPKGRHEQIGILERGKTESWSWLQALKWWNGKHKGI